MRHVGACALAILLSLLLPTARSVRAQVPRRVQSAQALAQIIKQVQPEVPPEAAAAKIGGTVIADVTIDALGKVVVVTILDGAPVLHAAADRAFRQWTFKPFLSGGKAGPVQTILEVKFPDPLKDEQDRILRAYEAATYACERQMEAGPALAQSLCAAAVRAADALPRDRVLERSHAVTYYATALMDGGRTREAIAEFERVLVIRSGTVKGADADSADVHQVLGSLHQRIGEFDKAETEFAAAVTEYTAAQELLPSMAPLYAPRFKSALMRYATLKRSVGDTAAAEALDARAAVVTVTPEPSDRRIARPPRVSRTVGDVVVIEPEGAQLTERDFTQICAELRSTGKKMWRLEVETSPRRDTAKGLSWSAKAYLEPESVSPTLRRGRVVYLGTTPPPGVQERERVWLAAQGGLDYIQVARRGGNPSDEPPIHVAPAANLPPLTDEEVVTVIRFVQGRAVAWPSDRVLSDIQPWPIDRVWGSRDAVTIHLVDPANVGSQTLELARQDGRWTIVRIRGFAGR